jgi:hypothetical protein
VSLPKYRIKINGQYLQGYDESKTIGKSGHMGWQPRATELSALVLTKHKEQAKIYEGQISLKSQFDRIYERLRYAGLTLERLEIEKVPEEELTLTTS